MVSKHLFQSLIGVLSSLIGTIAIFVIAGRSLGPIEFGQFAVVYAACSLFGILFDFGYMTRLLKEAGGDAVDGKILVRRETLIAKVILFFILSVALAVFSVVIGFDIELVVRFWIGVCLISIANLFGTTLRATGRHWLDARNNFLANVTAAVFAIYLYMNDATPHQFAMVFVVIGCVHLFTTLLVWRKFGSVSDRKVDVASIKAEMTSSIPYSVDALTQRSFFFLDVMVLGLVAPIASVGLYQAAQKVALAANIMAQPLSNVLLPKLSRIAQEYQPFVKLSKKMTQLYIVVAVVFSLGLILVGPFIIDVLYGEEFAEAKSLMWAFGLLIAIRYLSSSQNIQITALGMQKIRAQINAACVIIFVVAAYVLSSYLSGLGVIWAFVLVYSISGLGAFWVKRRHLKILQARAD